MLPYAPLHHLLFDAGAPDLLVMTSGNLADEPICIDPAEAEQRLAGLADVFVHHDRPIHVACDDSVTRVVAGSPQPVRRSRGYAPMPAGPPRGRPPMLAVGGELKTHPVRGPRAYGVAQPAHRRHRQPRDPGDAGAHGGDLVRAAAGHPRGDRVRRAPRLPVPALGRRPGGGPGDRAPAGRPPPCAPGLAAGRAPGARGGARPRRRPRRDRVRRRRHHLGRRAAPGQLRGGREGRPPAPDRPSRWRCRDPASRADRGGAPARGRARLGGHGQCRRLHPGRGRGARADARHGIALHAHDEHGSAVRRHRLAARRATRGRATRRRPRSSWRPWRPPPPRRRPVGGPRRARHGPVVRTDPTGDVSSTRRAGSPRRWPITRPASTRRRSSRAFHLALAEALTEAVLLVRDRHGIDTVGLTGGVFANDVLSSACQGSLRRAGLTVLVHGVVPPNDGGLALGQAAVAAAWSAR